MTKRKNMTAAQRQTAVEQKVEQLEMAGRISQMLLQQVGNSSNQMGKDLSEIANRQRDLQYRTIALQQLLDLKLEDVDARAEELQIKDFSEASDKEDIDKEYTVADTVAEDSCVIITSKVDDGDGILRSKLILSDLAFPQFKDDLLGMKVGDVVDADINGVTHHVEVLGIRTVPATPEPEPEVTVAEALEAQAETQNEKPAEANG